MRKAKKSSTKQLKNLFLAAFELGLKLAEPPMIVYRKQHKIRFARFWGFLVCNIKIREGFFFVQWFQISSKNFFFRKLTLNKIPKKNFEFNFDSIKTFLSILENLRRENFLKVGFSQPNPPELLDPKNRGNPFRRKVYLFLNKWIHKSGISSFFCHKRAILRRDWDWES